MSEGREFQGWVKLVKGLWGKTNKNKKKTSDNLMMITRKKGMGGGRRGYVGDKC